MVANKVDRLRCKDETLKALQERSRLPVIAISVLPGVTGYSVAAIEDLKKQLSGLLHGR